MKPEKKILNLLTLLGVKHTNKVLNSIKFHPNLSSLWGISVALNKYGIPNNAIKLHDFSALRTNNTRFISSVSGRFVICLKYTGNKVHCAFLNGKQFDILWDDFCQVADHNILIIHDGYTSKEPGYDANIVAERKHIAKQLLIFTSLFCLLLIGIIYNFVDYSLILIPIIFINIIGLAISFLLIQKQLDIHNTVSDKICGFIKESKCEDVTKSKGSKVFGIVSLSEIGFSYFLVNTIMLLAIPKTILTISIISICVLPFSFWSVWYQKYK